MTQAPDSLSDLDPVSLRRPVEWFRKSVAELRAALDAHEVTCLALVDAHFDRIACIDGDLGAFVEVFRESARAEAETRDAELTEGRIRGPLHGVPVSIKESFDLGGRSTTVGVRSRRATSAARDSAMVRALREAGAVVLGRTNVPQLLISYECDNPIYGRTSNPFSSRHSAGGSSGGEAAAIASGMSPLGIGSDLGGSVRVPACFCGVAALKPTPHRLPNTGSFNLTPGQTVIPVQTGLLARHASDFSLVLDALPAPKLQEIDRSVPPVTEMAAPSLRELRVGSFTDFGLLPASSAIVGGLERAADALRAAGAVVVPFLPPGLDDLYFEVLRMLSAEGGHAVLEALEGGPVAESVRPLQQLLRYPGAIRGGLSRMARITGDDPGAKMLDAFGEKPVVELYRSIERIQACRSRVLDTMEEHDIDAILCPAFATPALPHGTGGDLLVAGAYSMVWNAVGVPAGVVPVTRVHPAEARRDRATGRAGRLARKVDEQSAGLPVGVQIVAPPWRDRTVIALLAAIDSNVRNDVDFPRTPVG